MNRLAAESSPYLLQHKDNPVDWYPWGEAAFEEARRRGHPILLSVGYAACHWCHVMAHESFEDEETAAVMNRLFVNIKVDREERPDVDALYQSALQLLGQQGGWPLTMFLEPDGKPFWGGTYFPKRAGLGRPGFVKVLEGIAHLYENEPERVGKNRDNIRKGLEQLSQNAEGTAIPDAALDEVAAQLLKQFDSFYGGLGDAPKFPNVTILELLWRAWKRLGQEDCFRTVDLTLTRICQGGIYDHLGGGFARYAVDREWLVPHFEKMLYDNALLVEILTQVWQDTRNPLYETRIRETIAWLQREMMAAADEEGKRPTALFAASLDADSEGEEGRFYVWREEEIDRVLGEQSERFKQVYDVKAEGNWEGKTILNRSHALVLRSEKEEQALAEAREKLLQEREKRVRPGWDDKVLADWNGLMIAALAQAAVTFEEPDWLDLAERCFAEIEQKLFVEGRLYHSWRRGQAKHIAMLDDHTNLAKAALALFEATGNAAYLKAAKTRMAELDEHFWDNERGGYFQTDARESDLVLRMKNAHDSAIPSGNGTALGVLSRLYYLTGETAFRDRADALEQAFSGELHRNFFPLSTLLNQVDFHHSALQIVLIGDQDKADCRALCKAAYSSSQPNRLLQIVAPDHALSPPHPAAAMRQIEGKATAYLCEGQACSAPITEPEALEQALEKGIPTA